jgi:hypothetical protein
MKNQKKIKTINDIATTENLTKGSEIGVQKCHYCNDELSEKQQRAIMVLKKGGILAIRAFCNKEKCTVESKRLLETIRPRKILKKIYE